MDGREPLTADVLMDAALKYYQTRKATEEWGAETAEQKELINLTAQLQASRKEIGDLKRKFTNPATDDKDQKGKGRKGKGKKQGERKRAEEYRKERYNKAPQWMKKKPNDLNSTIDKDGKKYYWCTAHNLWQQHKATECRLNQKRTSDPPKETPKLQLADGIAAMATFDMSGEL